VPSVLKYLLGAVSMVLLACGGEPQTTVRLDVSYDAAWQLDGFELTAGGVLDRGAPAPTIRVLVPDDWAGTSLMIDLDGTVGGERIAHGSTEVTPMAGSEVVGTIVLSRLPCGAWCTEGSVACEGDGVVTCMQRDTDTCMEWSEPTACEGATPFCSLGVCGATCVDECSAGETRCAGPGGVETCGQGDADSCADWLPPVACDGETTCSNGACTLVCNDECEPGQVRCSGNGTSTCGDLDFDGCLEWSPTMSCPGGETCSGGICSGTCTDECSMSSCNGNTFTQCGQFDLDACSDQSPGTSCVPADPCREGECTAGGCTDAPKVCDQPSEPVCIDSMTLRTFQAAGTCSVGTCDYPYDDTTCPSGCLDGACVGTCGACTPQTILANQLETITLDQDATHLYFEPGTELLRRPKAGGAVETISTGNSFILDATHIYWISDSNTIVRRAKTGGAIDTIVTTTDLKTSLAVDGTHIYWATINPGNARGGIFRQPLGGGTIQTLVADGFGLFLSGVDGTHLYWFSTGLSRLPKGGGTVEAFATAAFRTRMTATHVYWVGGTTGNEGVFRRAKSGGTVETISTDDAKHLALDETYVYWTVWESGNHRIKRRALTGGGVQSVIGGLSEPDGLVIDADHLYWWNGDGATVDLQRLSRCGCGL
jgi:hypothetical protein